MLFLGAAAAGPITFEMRIGGYGVAGFWLHYYGPGPAITILGQQNSAPLQNRAAFPVNPPTIGWTSGIQSFIIQIAAVSTSTSPLPCTLDLIQSGTLLQAKDASGNSLNGSGPFGSVMLGNWTNGLVQTVSFAVHI